jgi:hypothetical protein
MADKMSGFGHSKRQHWENFCSMCSCNGEHQANLAAFVELVFAFGAAHGIISDVSLDAS